ncbi:hypothetical protein [Jannaschia sp. R86511]|uniref:hypothetical protein n=1 Tax=Jannaschia sp. R86511 TaxID=3093853 RepID=UPI0036D23BE6
MLTALAQTRVFGPLPSIRRTPTRQRRDRRDLALDLAAVGLAALSFFLSLIVLAGGLPDSSTTRALVATGLGLAGLGVFIHVAVTVWRMYNAEPT